MKDKILNWTMAIGLFSLFITLMYFTILAENEHRNKCEEAGMVYRQPWRERAYCAPGLNLNK